MRQLSRLAKKHVMAVDQRIFDLLPELRHPIAYDRDCGVYVVAPGLTKIEISGVPIETYDSNRHDGHLVCRGCEKAELRFQKGGSQNASNTVTQDHFVTKNGSQHDEECAYHPDKYKHVKIHAPIEIDDSKGYRLNLNGVRPPQNGSGVRLSGRDERGVWTNFDEDLRDRERESFSSLSEFFNLVNRIASQSPHRLWGSIIVHGQTKTSMQDFLTDDLSSVAGRLFKNDQHPVALHFNLNSRKNMMLNSGGENSVFLPVIQVYHSNMGKVVNVVPQIIFDDRDTFMSLRGKGEHYVMGVPFMRPCRPSTENRRALSDKDMRLSGVDYVMKLRVSSPDCLLQKKEKDVLSKAIERNQARIPGS